MMCKIKKKLTLQAKFHAMSEETISHEGVITKISDSELEIKILAQSACAACHAKSACGMGEQAEKILTVPKPTDRDFQLLQKVIRNLGDDPFVGNGFFAHGVNFCLQS